MAGWIRSGASARGAAWTWALIGVCVLTPATLLAGDDSDRPLALSPADSVGLARDVTIYRDGYGVPHIDGRTDEAVIFGFAYAQAEDYFWQVEDTYILALGRYSEVHGPTGLNSDMLNRAFEIPARSQADYPAVEPEIRRLIEAFVAGLNYYLATHPEVKPRLITRFEPWHVLAFGRHLTIEMTYRYTRLHSNYAPRTNPSIAAAIGSNAWAIAPQRTRSGRAMLLSNPHQPWFGFGQFYEAHLRSGEGWNFTGATFFGSPLPSLGHNEHLGWTFTVNEPDVADVWRETFDDPQEPLNYRYGDGYRKAVEWQDTIRVKTRAGVKERHYTFCKTHHGPIVAKEGEHHRLAANIARLHDSLLLRQMIHMVRARDLDEFRAAMARLEFPIMNTVYADRQGNIYYLYNGIVPRRDPGFDWSKPVDGSDPRTEWQGYHTLDELPQILNPAAGYLQSCNSSPFTTTHAPDLDPANFPPYMIEDKNDDKRRAKMSRQILADVSELTLDGLENLAFDTTVYWAQRELPRYARHYETLREENSLLAAQVRPYLEHLLAWDCRVTADSTEATLCEAWFEELHGTRYPGETLKPHLRDDPAAQLKALVQAAAALRSMHGRWRVPYGQIHRIQRHADVADLVDVPFSDLAPSLPAVAAHGPMGVIFTQYYTPSIHIPFVKSMKRRYGVVGATYLGVCEFGPQVQGRSLLHFGASGDPTSPHFFDQAELLSRCRLKPELFAWEQVRKHARRIYHPGQRLDARDGTLE